jgi:hypothetical protein
MAQPMIDQKSGGAVSRGDRRPRWSKWVIAAGVVVIAAVLVSVAVRLLDRRDFGSITLGGPVDRIDIQVARGDVELVAGGSDDVVVQRSSSWRFQRPDLLATIEGSTARVHATCPRLLPVSGCSVDHRVEVPPGVRVDVRTDSGSVTVADLDGWVRVVTSGGEVRAHGLQSDELLVDTNGGHVNVGFVRAPSRVDVVSGGGDVTVVAPADRYELAVNAGDGEIDDRLGSEEFAERSIQVQTNGGDLNLLPAVRSSPPEPATG